MRKRSFAIASPCARYFLLDRDRTDIAKGLCILACLDEAAAGRRLRRTTATLSRGHPRALGELSGHQILSTVFALDAVRFPQDAKCTYERRRVSKVAVESSGLGPMAFARRTSCGTERRTSYFRSSDAVLVGYC